MKVEINLNKILQFWENSEKNESEINIESSDKKNFTFNIKNKVIKNIEINWLNKKVIFFPIVKYNTFFKWISKFPKPEYIFLFLYLVDDNNIAIFSNNIFEYFEKIKETENIFKENEKEKENKKINNIDFEKMTSSFYLFTKEENTKIYKWKNILSFFSTFFTIALEDDTYKNLIYKIKWDSVAFFKSRYMQEKTIKTFITGKKQWENFIYAMFYWNLLKNLTFKIENNLIDLNWKWKWWFHITTLKNNENYFEKIEKVLEKINSVNIDKNNKLPIFFLEWNIWKNNNKELEEYNFIDMFPRVFKNDSKWNIFVLNFKNKEIWVDNKSDNQKLDTNLKDFFSFKKSIISDFLKLKDNIVNSYEYELLAKNDNEEKQDKEEKKLSRQNRNINNNDLFILFSKKNSKDLFLWKIKENCNEQKLVIKLIWEEKEIGDFTNCYAIKEEIKKYLENKDYQLSDDIIDIIDSIKELNINWKQLSCKKCEEKNKKYYIEAYKLHTEIWKITLENIKKIIINKKIDNSDKKNINFQYWNISNNKVFSFKFKNKKNEKKLNFYTDENINNDWLEYFFNWASISWEDMISLGLIAQLNKWKIFIWNKKAAHWELADIVWIKNEWNKSIIHLLHIKTSPFIVNWKIESYSYYTTAIWQILQKIEPILEGSSKNFFSVKVNLTDIKDEIYRFTEWLKLKEEIDIFKVKENFLTKIKNSTRIELRIWIAILKSQFDWKINNKVFYMVNDILLKWFEHTIKPFLGKKEVDIIFYPIIINHIVEKKEK